MSFLAALAVTQRVIFFLLAAAMTIGWWDKVWRVLMQKPGWQSSLSSFVLVIIADGIAVGSAVNMFPDAGWPIPENLRLIVLNVGMMVIIAGLLTGCYRRALRSGPEAARKALLSGLALFIPAFAMVALLTTGGANG